MLECAIDSVMVACLTYHSEAFYEFHYCTETFVLSWWANLLFVC